MTHKTLLTCALVTSIATSAYAVTPEERQARSAERDARIDERQERHQEQREAREEAVAKRQEAKEDRVEMREEKKAERDEMREEKKEDRLDQRADRSANRAERFARHWSYVDNRLDTVIERLQDAGADTSAMEGMISTLTSKAGLVQSAYNNLEEAIAGGDKEAIQSANAIVKETRQDLKTYYRETLRTEIRSLVADMKK